MTRHLEPVPDPSEHADAWEGPEGWEGAEDDHEPLRRPAWWRWVAVALVVAMVVATPVAYALYVWLR